jgi:hypothetical protein
MVRDQFSPKRGQQEANVDPCSTGTGPLAEKAQSKVESEIDKTNAASWSAGATAGRDAFRLNLISPWAYCGLK